MIYPYSARNRLVEPHRYMYTQFEGMSLLDAFLEARVCAMRHFESNSKPDEADSASVAAAMAFIDRNLAQNFPGTHAQWKLLAGARQQDDDVAQDVTCLPGADGDFAQFSLNGEVSTSALLCTLVTSQMSGFRQEETHPWLDRLIQRFEVTKRLYETYPAGFRNGIGDFKSLWRYWMFALALCLALARTDSLRLLNTLLKVCDLLCSVDGDDLLKVVPCLGMHVVLAMEGASVRSLMIEKRLTVAPV